MTTRRRASLLRLALLLPLACTTEEVFAPWDGGTAFPSRDASVPLPAHTLGFVTNSFSDTVSIVDVTTSPLQLLETVGVGRDPVALDGPHHVAVDRKSSSGSSGGYMYLALSYPSEAGTFGPHNSHGSSTRLGWLQVRALPTMEPVFETFVDENPGDIVLSSDASRIAISHFNLAKAIDPKLSAAERTGRLFVFDVGKVHGTSGTGAPRKIPVCRAPHGVLLDTAGKTAWVACYGEDSLVAVDVDAGAVTARLPFAVAGDTPTVGPYTLARSKSGDALAAGTTESHELRVVDLAAWKERFAVQLPGAVFFPVWSADDARIYVPTQQVDGIHIVDGKTGALRGGRAFSAAECVLPHEVQLAPGGASLLVVCEGDHKSPGSIIAIDATTLAFQGTLSVGTYPDRLALAEAP